VQAGVAAEIEVWPDVPHVFHVFGWLPEAKDAMQKVAAFLGAPGQPARLALPEIASSSPAVIANADSGIRLGA
jgi:hypothetical protein